MREVDAQFAFVVQDAGDRCGVLLEVGPRHVFSLSVVRGNVGVAPVFPLAPEGMVDQVGDTGDCFPTPAVEDEARPPLFTAMERDEL